MLVMIPFSSRFFSVRAVEETAAAEKEQQKNKKHCIKVTAGPPTGRSKLVFLVAR
jgi:hypothetical protein